MYLVRKLFSFFTHDVENKLTIIVVGKKVSDLDQYSKRFVIDRQYRHGVKLSVTNQDFDNVNNSLSKFTTIDVVKMDGSNLIHLPPEIIKIIVNESLDEQKRYRIGMFGKFPNIRFHAYYLAVLNITLYLWSFVKYANLDSEYVRMMFDKRFPMSMFNEFKETSWLQTSMWDLEKAIEYSKEMYHLKTWKINEIEQFLNGR